MDNVWVEQKTTSLQVKSATVASRPSVGQEGFEPTISCLSDRCFTKLSYYPICTGSRDRTYVWPANLSTRYKLEDIYQYMQLLRELNPLRTPWQGDILTVWPNSYFIVPKQRIELCLCAWRALLLPIEDAGNCAARQNRTDPSSLEDWHTTEMRVLQLLRN